MNRPELITRSVTGLFIGAVTLFAIIYSPWTYLVWLCFIIYMGTREYFILEKVPMTPAHGATIPFLLAAIVGATGFALIEKASAIPVLLFLPAAIGLRFLFQLFVVQDVSQLVKVNNTIFSAAGYLGLPSLCGCLFLIDGYQWPYVLIPVILIWINDIGAYLIGSQWGKHKIAPAISPGKSIEGTIGGGISTVIAGFLLTLWMVDIPMAYIITLSLTIPVFALAGDLWESSLKRYAGVKDSGNLLPGHGGILDRYDSLLFVMPVAALAYFIFVL